MQVRTASSARANLYRLIDEVQSSHEPVIITGKRSNAVLIAEEDWRAIEETLYLTSMPRLRVSIVDGLNTPLAKTSKTLKW